MSSSGHLHKKAGQNMTREIDILSTQKNNVPSPSTHLCVVGVLHLCPVREPITVFVDPVGRLVVKINLSQTKVIYRR